MNWQIEVKPTAEKQYLKLDKKIRRRVKKALKDLECSENPFTHKNVKPLTGQLHGDFRLRIGGWRILFTSLKSKKLILVYAILPRGDAY